jgi:predicted transcriptional regulator
MEPYEIRNVAEKILDGTSQGKTISEISHELSKISSSTIRKIVKRLEEAGLIEEVN